MAGLAQRKKILITDDDPGIRDAIGMMLNIAGYEPILYSNGNKLLDGTYEKPALFLLDKQLAGVSGLDICRHLKSQEASKNIPVIILSATPHIRKMARDAQADDFIEKPFKMQELMDKIADHLADIQH